MERTYPANLKEVLGATPLLHLLPVQETVPCIAPTGIGTSMDAAVTESNRKLIRAINADPERFDDFAKKVSDEVAQFDSEDLRELKFPYFHASNSASASQNESLSRLHQAIYDAADPIGVDEIVSPSTSETAATYEVSRLSVRKKYNRQSIQHHNEKYRSKFLKEYEMGNTANVNLKQIKRPLEEDVHLATNKVQKTTSAQRDAFDRICDKLFHINSLVGLYLDENTDNAAYWIQSDGKYLVTMEIMVMYHDCLLKLMVDPKIDTIDIDQITRVQKLMWRSLLELKEFNSDELHNMLGQGTTNTQAIVLIFDDILLSTLAAKIMLVILNGRLNNKSIYIDEYLMSVVDLINSLHHDILIRLSTKVFTSEVVNVLKPKFYCLTEDFKSILQLISTYLSNYTVEESVLTRLEYLSMEIIYADLNRREDSSLVTISSFENLKASACDLILQIFTYYPDQRDFILNEIIIGFDRLSTSRLYGRQFKTLQGNKVQLISALLVSMVENLPYKKLSEFKSENLKDDVLSHTSELSSSILTGVNNFVNQITSFLLSKFSRNPEMKTIIEIMLEDLLVLLPYPEWAGSEVLLVGFMRTLILTIQNQNFQNIEIHLFDFLGKICESLVDIRKSSTVLELSTATEFAEFQSNLESVFGHIHKQAKKNSRYNLAAKFLAIKQIVELKKMENHVDKTDLQLAGLNSESENATANNEIIHTIQQIHSFLVKILLDESDISLTGLNLKSQYIEFILRGDLFSLYETFLNLLSKSLESPKIKTKSKAIRTLSMLVDKDTDILGSQRIQESVSLRLSDNSLSVRDAVIDLFGKIVDFKPELLQNFYKPICECINDPSVQVRKRVIKLMGGMFDSLDSNKAKVYVSAKLLMGLYDEEDSVIDLIKPLLVQIWFDKEDTSNLKVLVDIVGLGGKILKAFEEFLTKDLIKNQRDTLEHVTILLLDDIHDMTNHSEIEKSLKLISTFVKSDTSLINQEQLISLQSFLVEEKNEGDITFYNLEILKHVLPEINSLRPDYLQSVQTFLIQNLAKFSIKELNEAMPCIWRLCQMKRNTLRLANACVSCMKMLRPFIEKKSLPEPNPRLEKLIHLLGSFGTHCKFEEFRELFLKSSLGLKEKESIVSGIIKYLLYFCEGDGRVKNAAIKNVMNVCNTHPKFFMSDPILHIFDNEFEKCNPIIIHSIIKGLLKFLVLEENYSEKQNGTSKKMSNKLKLDIDVFHGNSKSYMTDGICAGLVQRYIDRILELCLHDNNTLSFSCVEFLQLVIQQGFANPRTCIPTVIALEASDNRRIRNIAVNLHSELYEKHESLTDTSYFEGTKLAMKYAKNNLLSFFEKDSFIADLYGVVKSNYSSRKKFIQSIIKFVQVRSDTQEPKEQRDEVIWICLNLGSTNFYSLEEVLRIINRIDVVLEDEGVEISEQLNNEDLSELKESEEFDSQVYFAQSFLAILQLRDVLVTNYGITTNQIESFRPHKVDSELRQQAKTISEKKKFIVDVENDPIDYIVQYLQAIKDYL